jgi:protein-tyrosine phosphatase
VAEGGEQIRFEACFNFRDLGGHLGLDGRRVRSEVLYRSDSLHRLSGSDLELVGKIGVRTVVDLRTTGELTSSGRFPGLAEVAFHHVPLFEQEDVPFELARPGDPEPPGFADGIGYLAIAAARGPAIKAALEVIAGAEHAVVFHCTAGKDRTGVVAALLLSALGVADEAIVDDYRRSDGTVEAWLKWAEERDPETAARFVGSTPRWVMQAPARVMRGFLGRLWETFGSIEGYLAAIGVDGPVVGALRDRFLE